VIKVLVFSKDFRWYGGVVNFVSALFCHLGENVEASHFVIGERKSKWVKLPGALISFYDGFRLAIAVLTRDFDAYHINPSLNFNSILRDGLFLIILRAFKARNVIVTFHGWDQKIEEIIVRNKLCKVLFQFAFGYATHIMVLAEDFKKSLIAFGLDSTKIHLYTTMFNSEEFLRFQAVRYKKKRQILFLSRIVPGKGVYELVSAFSKIIADDPDLKLVFAGSGSEEDSLRKFVSDSGVEKNIYFIGYVRREEKLKALLESEIFILPSESEGCPVSMLEAMAAALPVIATSVGGIPHIIKDSKNGILLSDASPNTIEKAIRVLLSNPNIRRSIGQQNRKEAWEKYSSEIVARRFEKLYAGDSCRWM